MELAIHSTENRYKTAGYTHLIKYKEWIASMKLYVNKQFPTSSDAVDIHVRSLSTRNTVTEIVATQL